MSIFIYKLQTNIHVHTEQERDREIHKKKKL